MTAPIDALREAAAPYTTRQLAQSLRVLDREEPSPERNLVRAAMIQVVEARNPWTDELMDQWVEDDADARTYVQALIGLLDANPEKVA